MHDNHADPGETMLQGDEPVEIVGGGGGGREGNLPLKKHHYMYTPYDFNGGKKKLNCWNA